MSRDEITRKPVPSAGKTPSGGSVVMPRVPATPHDNADEIINTIGKDNLLDIKFLIEPSSATRDEILAAALIWVKSAEKQIAAGLVNPLSD